MIVKSLLYSNGAPIKLEFVFGRKGEAALMSYRITSATGHSVTGFIVYIFEKLDFTQEMFVRTNFVEVLFLIFETC